MHRHTQDTRAKYNIVKTTNEVVFIEDVGHTYTMSVTNDAEGVVYELVNKHKIGNKRIIYKDSEGQWDELLHDGDQFVGFAPGI